MAKYEVIYSIRGLTKKPLVSGDIIDLEPDVAGPLLKQRALRAVPGEAEAAPADEVRGNPNPADLDAPAGSRRGKASGAKAA